MSSTKKIVYIALLVAQALIIGLIEGMFPAPFAFAPGAKLGLANLLTVLAIFTMRKREVALFVALRLLLQMILAGSASVFLYSCAGMMLSVILMYLVKTLGPKRVSIIGISAVGGFFHNVGQLLVASVLARTFSIMNYLPMMSIIGILAGIFVGVCGNFLLQHIQLLKNAHFVLENGDTQWLSKE